MDPLETLGKISLWTAGFFGLFFIITPSSGSYTTWQGIHLNKKMAFLICALICLATWYATK